MINVGIIGCGKMASAHINVLQQFDDVKITAVCDIDEAKRLATAETAGANAYADYAEMLEQEELSLVVICLPPAMHGDCVRYCAGKGVNIFIEKPMGIDTADCRLMIEACKENGVKLFVGHMQRYLRENQIAKALVESGKYGKLVAIHEVRQCQYPNPVSSPKWLMDRSVSGGGMMYNLGAHTIDMAQYISGSCVDIAECGVNFMEAGTENMAVGFLKLENGVAVTFNLIGSCSVSRYEKTLYLTDGEIRINPHLEVSVCGRDGVFETIADNAVIYANGDKDSWQYLQFCDVLAALKNGDVKVSGEYGLGIIETMEKLYKSAGRN